MTRILLILTFFFSLNQIFAEEYYSASAGPNDWTDPNAWGPVGVPDCGDTIYIQAGHTIEVTSVIDYNASCSVPMFVEVYGDLVFDGGGSKLRLPGGSGVSVGPAGLITATGGGGGSSKTIEIGGVTVWDANDPPVGPGEGFGTPLGNEVLYFSGIYSEGKVSLEWQTGGFFDGDFIVERSYDNTNWVTVQKLKAKPSQLTSYFCDDYQSDFEKAFYRLSFEDLSGNLTYRETIIVINESSEHFSFKIIPNPTEGHIINLVVGTPEPKKVNALVLDGNGQVVFNEPLALSSGNNLYSLYTKLKPFGMYYVTLYDDRHSSTEKVVIGK